MCIIQSRQEWLNWLGGPYEGGLSLTKVPVLLPDCKNYDGFISLHKKISISATASGINNGKNYVEKSETGNTKT